MCLWVPVPLCGMALLCEVRSQLLFVTAQWPCFHQRALNAGDLNKVYIGPGSSVGDRAVLHTSKSVEGKPDASCSIGQHVRIGE
jgi:hypothetical protein